MNSCADALWFTIWTVILTIEILIEYNLEQITSTQAMILIAIVGVALYLGCYLFIERLKKFLKDF